MPPKKKADPPAGESVRKTVARKKAAAKTGGGKRAVRPVTRPVLAERMRSGPITSYELANVLGLYYSDMSDTYLTKASVGALIELARQIDVHPADLVPELDSVLHLRRLPPDPEDDQEPDPADQEDGHDARQDAAVILTALSAARGPLTPGALSDALAWSLDRVQDAIELIATQPELASPLGLRRHVAGSYTLTTRLDLLTGKQYEHLHRAADMDAFEFTAAHTALLLAAVGSGLTERYARWRETYQHEHAELVEVAVLLPLPDDPDRVEVAADVLYSLGGRP